MDEKTEEACDPGSVVVMVIFGTTFDIDVYRLWFPCRQLFPMIVLVLVFDGMDVPLNPA